MARQTQKGLIWGLLILLVLIAGGYLVYSYFTSPVTITSNDATSTVSPIPTPLLEQSSPVVVDSISPVSPLSTPSDPPTLSEEVFAIIEQAEKAYEQGNYEQALTLIDEAVATEPFNPFAFNTRGNIYVALEQPDKALLDYDQAIELDPGFPGPYYNKGRLLFSLNRLDEAITHLQKSVELSADEFGYRANGNIGLIYHQQGKYDEALKAFAQAISFDAAKADTYYFRAETYTAMGNFEAAITDYQAAVSRFPRYDLAYQGLAYAYYKTGQYDQALQALQQAADISPASATPHFYRMLVYLATDRPDEAKAEISQGMESISALSEEDQNRLFTRVLADLDTFAKENPDQAENVKSLVNLIPPPG